MDEFYELRKHLTDRLDLLHGKVKALEHAIEGERQDILKYQEEQSHAYSEISQIEVCLKKL